MKNLAYFFLFIPFIIGCQQASNDASGTMGGSTEGIQTHSQSGVVDETSQPDVVKVAVGSKDHTTLVKAVQTAELVDALSNAGPFTVFAPVNAAFDKLPKGTLDDLLKPENKDKLTDILYHHVYVGVLKTEQLTDGMNLGMVEGNNLGVAVKDGKVVLNGNASIIASVPASNGIIHVIDEVLVPQK